jgi:phage tail-like protein
MLDDPATSDPFLPRFLRIFEDIAGGVQSEIDDVVHLVDVSVTDLRFVRWIGSWMGVDVDSSLPGEVQRRLVRAAGRWLGLRGTVSGLEGFVAEVTGSRCLVIDQGGVYRVGQTLTFGLGVTVFVEDPGPLTIEQLGHYVDHSMPAGSRAELVVGRLPVARPEPRGPGSDPGSPAR